MSDHGLGWIGPYHDGELDGEGLRAAEAHLRSCAACRAELAALQELRARLQAEPPGPARTPPDQFVAQVRLRLGPPAGAPQRLRQAAGLWLPLGLLGVWALGQAVLAVGGLALAVTNLPQLPLLAWPTDWRGWLALWAVNLDLTATVAVLAWGSLAGWWAAGKPDAASSGTPA